ncbi:5-amino-6-(D-ribitylamino)uracil--L-tyrosine 4-hydroxyphenyl transferase CofH [Hydrogenophaga sp.]|uniref:5-amino-6-(D-ribitylamino)uracil--L-tyrosine 4-hydroxyphenyl transferase CofH n=1 Tax=Hydrogenophaga sp. TaxID=1904254 RepID=UPI002717EC2C|nr:5-amino-6-(D-ribitylamino)uracil--L-tyrosine 4-hydroxyphenyl transferase CofH [Hydrogenophaga sp.]MDO9433947.1 5-amino-6-(D-ribitylamino)uracil--L-tyrosine 4-hydroxyphenyl transferase CofH [Hydrogenophaga sp.]
MSDSALRERLLAASAQELAPEAAALRDAGHGAFVSYSRKVFIPLTRLCRDVCRYCTFAASPREVAAAYMTPEEVLAVARAGEQAGCREALFTLGDKPELRYAAAREQLAQLGYPSTIAYLTAMCELVTKETSLLAHANPGVMTREEMAMLRRVSVSQGIMLESTSRRLMEKGGAHYGCPDKDPDLRLQVIREAGELGIPFTTGILIGIGETREERLDALLALRDLQAAHGHIQEVIVQNFRAKADTPMARAVEPGLEDLQWTVAAARIVLGPAMNLQVPPNLSAADYPTLIDAGINDWGGVSPVTPDHVNPEMPWPQLDALARRTQEAGKQLVERLAVYPTYALASSRWQDANMAPRVWAAIDAHGFARTDAWSPGALVAPPVLHQAGGHVPVAVSVAIARAEAGFELSVSDIEALFAARGAAFDAVCAAADALRAATCGETVRFVVNRNINYTNICAYRCTFCAFSKSTGAASLRGPAYDLDLAEVARRVREAWQRGATEVCMQGGIHPQYTGDTYLQLLHTVKEAVPQMHVHAFSPLEVLHGAQTLGLSVEAFLVRLRDAGLGSLPGTAAEILDDEMRAILCPDKLTASEWLQVIEAAHGVGLRTTATIMFGHVDAPRHWAKHLLEIRRLQARTGGFTEFVPLPFVHMEAPIFFKGRARKGPTWREAVLMHAVARLVLHPLIPNIQVSWVKMGAQGAQACLNAGANDMGGTLTNESISRAAGTQHGQEMVPARMNALIERAGRVPQQRTTLYGPVPQERVDASHAAAPVSAIVLTPPSRKSRATAGA